MNDKKLVYDICAVPDGVTLDKVIDVWKKHDVIIYDSFKGNPPVLYNHEELNGETMVDISTLGMEKLSKINKLLGR